MSSCIGGLKQRLKVGTAGRKVKSFVGFRGWGPWVRLTWH